MPAGVVKVYYAPEEHWAHVRLVVPGEDGFDTASEWATAGEAPEHLIRAYRDAWAALGGAERELITALGIEWDACLVCGDGT